MVIAIRAAHEMALRATAYPADALHGLGWNEKRHYQQSGALTAVGSVSDSRVVPATARCSADTLEQLFAWSYRDES